MSERDVAATFREEFGTSASVLTLAACDEFQRRVDSVRDTGRRPAHDRRAVSGSGPGLRDVFDQFSGPAEPIVDQALFLVLEPPEQGTAIGR